MKKSTKYFLIGFTTVAATTAAVAAANQLITNIATHNSYLNSIFGGYYESKIGRIFYKKQGSGTPILLIHNVYYGYGSSYEWNKVEEILAKDHTVYSIDLPGCGRSDKSSNIYTNFMFVHAINSFIDDIIGEPVELVTSGDSSEFGIMAAVMRENQFKKITMINPAEIMSDDYNIYTTFTDKVLHILRSGPIFGTMMYNFSHTKMALDKLIAFDGFYNPNNINSYDLKSMYKAAHIGGSKSKGLVNSIRAKYTNINTAHGLSKLSLPIKVIISGPVYEDSMDIANDYIRVNPKNTSCDVIEHAKDLVALERPNALCKLL